MMNFLQTACAFIHQDKKCWQQGMSPMSHIPFPWNQHPRDDSHCTVLLFGISSPSTFYPLN